MFAIRAAAGIEDMPPAIHGDYRTKFSGTNPGTGTRLTQTHLILYAYQRRN
jgi:hypothetical protein